MGNHADLTGAELHESKGVAAASVSTVYVADGAGSGAWTSRTIGQKMVLTLHIPDIGAADSTYLLCPLAGTIDKIYVVNDQATATNPTVLTCAIGGVAITNGVVTIAAAVAEGVGSSATPTAARTVSIGSSLSVASDGGTTGTVIGTVTFLISLTA